MSDETTEAPEEVTEEVAEESGKFEGLFDDKGHYESPSDDSGDADEEVADEVADEGEVSEEEGEAEQPAEPGTTTAMQTLAKQAELPDELISVARDDKQLQEFIDLAASSRAEPEAQEAEEAFQIELPEDEYSEDDPLRKELIRLNKHYERKTQDLTNFARDATTVIRNLHEQAQHTQESEAREFQLEFDERLDELNPELFGTRESMGENHFTLRKVTFEKAQELKNTGAKGSPQELTEKAYQELFPNAVVNNRQAGKQEATKRQARKRLGNGAPPRTPEPEPSKMEKTFAKWDKILGS